MISNKEEYFLRNFLKTLKENPLFGGLDESDIEYVLKSVNAKTVKKSDGEYVLHAGDRTEFMGVVLSGSVLVVQEDVWGRRNIMSRITEGDSFAEIFASLPGAALNVSVIAEGDCAILLLNVEPLLSLSTKNSRCGGCITKNLVSILAKKTMALNEKITHISKRATRDKLLSFLSSEAIRRGARSFDISYNRQQLADYLCVERAAMSVELSKLQKEGLIKYNKNHFELICAAELL